MLPNQLGLTRNTDLKVQFISQYTNIHIYTHTEKYIFKHTCTYTLKESKTGTTSRIYVAQSAGSVEYTDCTSAEG